MSELKAGRELDALVAEKVMGWRPMQGGVSMEIGEKDDLWEDGSRKWYGKDGDPRPMRLLPSPKFSTDIAAAWLVVEKLIARGDEFTLERISLDKVWRAKVYPFTKDKGWAGGGYFTSSNDVAVNAKTAPLAICRAALLAVGAQ